MSDQIAADLERKFVDRLQELYDREGQIMAQVLAPDEICLILIRVVTGSVLTTAANEQAAKHRAATSARAVRHHAARWEAGS